MPRYEKITTPEGPPRASARSLSRAKRGRNGVGSLSPDSMVREENPVEACLKVAVRGVAWTLSLWCIGLLFLAINAVDPKFLLNWYMVFMPFWAGDLMAIFVQARVLVSACSFRFLPNERLALRRYMQDQQTQAVDMNYLPLVQKVVFTVVVSVPTLLMVIAFQVLVCMRLTEGAPTAAMVALPLFILEGLCLVHFCMIRDHSATSAATWCLLFMATAALTTKFDGALGESFPYMVAFAPLWLLNMLFFVMGMQIHVDHCRGLHFLSKRQRVALNLYLGALLISWTAELLVACEETGSLSVPSVVVPLLFTLASMFCATSIFMVAKRNAKRLLLTKGYEEPLPLSKTQEGWEPSGGGTSDWFLLGAIEQRVRLRSNGEMETGSSRHSSFEQRGSSSNFHRSDSGSYADLYDDV